MRFASEILGRQAPRLAGSTCGPHDEHDMLANVEARCFWQLYRGKTSHQSVREHACTWSLAANNCVRCIYWSRRLSSQKSAPYALKVEECLTGIFLRVNKIVALLHALAGGRTHNARGTVEISIQVPLQGLPPVIYFDTLNFLRVTVHASQQGQPTYRALISSRTGGNCVRPRDLFMGMPF